MNEMPVTLVTSNASVEDTCNTGYDDIDQLYRDIYEDLRQGRSLDQFVKMVDSQYSKAWWSKWERGVTVVTRQAKNELRKAAGLEPLVPTVTEAMADVHPDAEVWRIGDDEIVRRVVKIATSEKTTILSNGIVEVRNENSAPPSGCNPGYTQDGEQRKPAKVYWRPSLPLSLKQRAQDAGLNVEQLVRNALEMTT